MKLIRVAAAVLNQIPLDWAGNESRIREAIQDARAGSTDLGNRLESDAAKQTRKASIVVRTMLEEQWQNA